MSPVVRPGDELELEWRPRRVTRGDVVVFHASGETVVHRVVAVRCLPPPGHGRRLVTKGDRVGRPDPEIAAEQVLARVVVVRTGRGVMRLDTPAARWLGIATGMSSLFEAAVWKRLDALAPAGVVGRTLPARVVRKFIRKCAGGPALLLAALCAAHRRLAMGRGAGRQPPRDETGGR